MVHEEENKKIAKDMTLDFNFKLSSIQDEIDIHKKEMLFDPFAIVKLDERLEALAQKLECKMSPEEKVIEDKFTNKCSQIALGKYRPVEIQPGVIAKRYYIIPKNLANMKILLKRRESHLNSIMERLGLTARERKTGRTIF